MNVISMSSVIEYNGYHAKIEYDAEDDIFVGEVIGIVDSLSFHGSSIEEIHQMFEQSIDNYLDFCEKIGKEPNKEFKGSFNIRIPSELHKKVCIEAAKENISQNQYIIKALEKSFKVNNKQEIVYIIPSFKVNMTNTLNTPETIWRGRKIYLNGINEKEMITYGSN